MHGDFTASVVATMITKLSVRILAKSKNCVCLCGVLSRNIMTWQTEKEKYLKMTIADKKALNKKTVSLSEIPTWKAILDSKQQLAKKIPRLPHCEINYAHNKELAKKVSYYLGDITTLAVDVIVNAANKSLLGGGGVDGAIHKAAGSSLLQECKTLMGCNVGEAKITGGYQLPAKYIIHTVGPQGEKPEFLKECYKNCLKVMTDQNLRTIAFPCISTGIYGYPIEPAAHVAVNEVRKFLETNASKIERIVFCLYAETDEIIYQGVLQSYFPGE